AVIDERGLHPSAGGVQLAEVREIVACFDYLNWEGITVGGCPVLRSYTLKNDFRDGEKSPIYLSEHASQGIYFAIPSSAGGEKNSACRFALRDLRRFQSDASFREQQLMDPDQWRRPGAKHNITDEHLAELDRRLDTLSSVEARCEEESRAYRYAVIYAIRPPTAIRSTWEDCRGMGLRCFDPIPPSWFIAKLRIYPAPRPES
ncbi:MAG: hypothetical protein IIB57_16815, partial [Planctomycetes bacterium]|nr:hypothetical protein [Planctomycetota bacterium]